MMRRLFIFGMLLLYRAGEAALACPRCFAEAGEEQRDAYLGTTVLLSALPLVLIGFLAARIYQGSRNREDSP